MESDNLSLSTQKIQNAISNFVFAFSILNFYRSVADRKIQRDSAVSGFGDNCLVSKFRSVARLERGERIFDFSGSQNFRVDFGAQSRGHLDG